MGLAPSSFDIQNFEGRLFMPQRSLAIFPEWRRRPPGHIVVHFHALPNGYPPPASQDVIWWVDCRFLPFRDNELVLSVGAFENRPGRSLVWASNLVQGVLRRLKFSNKMDSVVYKGTKTSALPNVELHPDGSHVCYVGQGFIKMMNFRTQKGLKKDKDLSNNNFRNVVVSPNGMFIAILSRMSMTFELSVCFMQTIMFITQDTVPCHQISPDFRGTQAYTERTEIKFSPDSKCIAVAASFGLLFVVDRRGLTQKCDIVPGMFKGSEDFQCQLANERSFDFDPRCMHRRLAFGSTTSMIYICDIDTATIEEEAALLNLDFDTENEVQQEIQCLKYGTYGRTLAVATNQASIHIFNPDTLDLLYSLDAAGQSRYSSMQIRPDYNTFPEILRLSYNHVEDLLAVSSTDGCVRVFQLEPDLSLQHICRTAIFKYVKICNIPKLRLPNRVILYLLSWPVD